VRTLSFRRVWEYRLSTNARVYNLV